MSTTTGTDPMAPLVTAFNALQLTSDETTVLTTLVSVAAVIFIFSFIWRYLKRA